LLRLEFFLSFNSYIMEKVDLVLVGAEGVVESGGIINKVKENALHHSVNCIKIFLDANQ